MEREKRASLTSAKLYLVFYISHRNFASYMYCLKSLNLLEVPREMPHKQYRAASVKPTPPPMAHFLNPAVDLYSNPVVVPARTVLISSSSPRAHCSNTPKPEYITAMVPSVFAVADPCFMT